jgi:hypothetical protein
MTVSERGVIVQASHPSPDLQHYDVGWHNGLTEGERRATAAIVAYLRKVRGDPAFYRVCMEVDNLRNRIEAGHHLPGDAGGSEG